MPSNLPDGVTPGMIDALYEGDEICELSEEISLWEEAQREVREFGRWLASGAQLRDPNQPTLLEVAA